MKAITRVLLRLITASLLASVIQAAEVDSMTARNLELADVIDTVNGIVQARLAQGVANANARDAGWLAGLDGERYCDEGRLYTELRKAIFQSSTASLGLKGYDLDLQLRELLQGHALALEASIYRDLGYFEAFSVHLKELSELVNLGGHRVGLDKVGHFFAQGWQYFELSTADGGTLEQALALGGQQEQGRYGYLTTGVFSYADLAANFNGWRFWNRVLLRDRDPLGGFFENLLQRPYLSCEVRVFESIRQRTLVHAWRYHGNFNIADYVDGAWDEGNNCNDYRTPIIKHKVLALIRRTRPDYACPLQPQTCVEARWKYGPYAPQVLHPQCLSAG
jgi:hypothetical protein